MNPYIHPKVSPLSQSHITIEIEKLVNDIITGKPRRLFVGYPLVSRSDYWFQFYMILRGSLDRYLSTYSTGLHDYTEHQSAFFYGCQAAGLLPQYNHYGLVLHRMQPLTLEQVKILVAGIQAYAASVAFRRQASDRLHQMKIKNQRQEAEVRDALGKYAKSLIIAMQLGIEKPYQHLVNIDQFFEYMRLLNREIEIHPLFTGKLFTTKGIEQGSTKGYHMHLGFIFNGHEHRKDMHFAFEIRRLWLNITQGMGTFRTSNTAEEKAKYSYQGRLGVGMIHRSDSNACDNAVRVLCYTTKVDKIDQYLRIRPSGRRAFTRVSTW